MRRRWTEERRMQREHAEWIVGYLRVHGPMTTRAIIEALSLEGRPIEAHILSRALRKSPFVSCVDKVIVDGQQQSVWAFQIDGN
ncbi:MAG: hypothetical protein VXY42_03680 [Candidatus Thermoplasmatota archaeon]|jgi:hypothetical protein|nr:hypothetical protein [Candidatus Thermoplasmatota archaeon]MEC7254018.1 hypothetical protein [Candidatus Thermoplasmatota archaeon]MEC8609588.1 hypothetical protein [Candidatus Thermoplasmatota archaeon]